MLILVDYDNVDELLRTRGVVHVINSIVIAASSIRISPPSRIYLRLYGGWCDQTRLSKKAQIIARDISCYPVTQRIAWAGQESPVEVSISCQLATSLVAAERDILHYTFRTRPFSDRLQFKMPSNAACAPSHCTMNMVQNFFSNQRCPAEDCSRPQSEFLQISEQKMVDSMIVSDLVYWAHRQNHPQLAVVSSDDDIWPGIRTAIAITRPIIQIHTKRSNHHGDYAKQIGQGVYYEVNL